MLRLRNSSLVTEGLVMSSAPHSPDIQRIVNVSLSSTEETFEHDLGVQLFTFTSEDKILQTSGEDNFFTAFTIPIFYQ